MLLPQQGSPPGGGLAMPQGAPQGLMAPPMPQPDVPPAALGVQALAPMIAPQQQVLDQVKAALAAQAQEQMAAAMQQVAGIPNPAALGAQTEPSPPVDGGVGQADSMQGGGY